VFWKKKPAANNQPSSSSAALSAGGATSGLATATLVQPTRTIARASGVDLRDLHDDSALDSAVAFLRTFGRYAFEITGTDAATFSRHCEAWAEHLSIGAIHPDAELDTTLPQAGQRDWAGARRFFSKRRQKEAEFITQGLGDLREVVADLTERLATTLSEDEESAQQVTEQVDCLRKAITIDSLDGLRREVVSTATLLSALIEQQNQRIQEQLRALDQRVLMLSEELQEVKQESSLDALTRVYNRGAFDRAFHQLHRLAMLSDQPSSLLIADLDNLKQINDRFGHRSGDAALRHFADCLVRGFPRRTDFIARYGGDEFVAILPQTPVTESERFAVRFLDSIHGDAVLHDENALPLTASIGLAELRRGELPEAWLERADQALYQAKERGRDCLIVAA
jgi:diguanylate cyclase